jgi:hypothetical protein
MLDFSFIASVPRSDVALPAFLTPVGKFPALLYQVGRGTALDCDAPLDSDKPFQSRAGRLPALRIALCTNYCRSGSVELVTIGDIRKNIFVFGEEPIGVRASGEQISPQPSIVEDLPGCCSRKDFDVDQSPFATCHFNCDAFHSSHLH